MATADEYAAWIVQNADKRGTPEFETVAQAYQVAKSQPTSDHAEHGALSNWTMGGLKGASDIGATLLSPVDYVANKTGLYDMTNKDRRSSLQDFFKENADPHSLPFQVGSLATQIGGTAGAPGALAKGMGAIPAIARFAPAVATSGFNLGPATTGSGVVNTAIRAGAGAIGGGLQAGMVDPSSAGRGAMIGAATPGVVQAAGAAGNMARKGFESGADRLMQSALKPTIEQLRSGKAATASQTLLDEGLNATRGGVDALKGRIDDINSEVGNRIATSGATVDRQRVVDALRGTQRQFSSQVSPTGDLAAIDAVKQDFLAHPMVSGNDIPVQLAQELKQGTYRVLSKKYGQLGSAETEAQKALARGLKEQISQAVPEVGALNARESRLISTLDVAERRALMDANKNPMGLAILAHNPATWAAFMADKSALFKSVAARMLNQASKVSVPQALPQIVNQQGLLGAPALLSNAAP